MRILDDIRTPKGVLIGQVVVLADGTMGLRVKRPRRHGYDVIAAKELFEQIEKLTP